MYYLCSNGPQHVQACSDNPHVGYVSSPTIRIGRVQCINREVDQQNDANPNQERYKILHAYSPSLSEFVAIIKHYI